MKTKILKTLLVIWLMGVPFKFGWEWSRGCKMTFDYSGNLKERRTEQKSVCSAIAGVGWPLDAFIWIMHPDTKFPTIKIGD